MLMGMMMRMPKPQTDLGPVGGGAKKDPEKILNLIPMPMQKHQANIGPLGGRARRDQEIRNVILMPMPMPIGIKHQATPGPPGVGA